MTGEETALLIKSLFSSIEDMMEVKKNVNLQPILLENLLDANRSTYLEYN